MTDLVRSPPNYVVKSIETVAEGRDLRARLFTLSPGDVIPWHFHSEVTDWYFCLTGTIRIETHAPRADEFVGMGGSYTIFPKTAHRISNGGDSVCRFLLLQGVGVYDFNELDTSDSATLSTH